MRVQNINTSYSERNSQPNFGTFKFENLSTLKKVRELWSDSFIPLNELGRLGEFKPLVDRLIEKQGMFLNNMGLIAIEKKDIGRAFRELGYEKRYLAFEDLIINPWHLKEVTEKDLKNALKLKTRKDEINQKITIILMGFQNIFKDFRLKSIIAKLNKINEEIQKNPLLRN